MSSPVRQLRDWFAGFGRDGQQTLLLLIAVACITAPHAGHLPWWATMCAALTFIAKIGLIHARKGAPQRWLLASLGLALAGVTVLQFGTIIGRDAGVTLLVMLICAKLLELRTRRDSLIVICLGFFLALCQFLYSQTIPSALVVLAGVAMLLLAQVAQHLDGDPSCDAAPSIASAWPIALRMLGLALPLTVAMFVVFPRIPGPLWGAPGEGADATTGLSDTMSPGSMSALVESDAMAFRVRFDGPTPPPQFRYFRAMVLGDFNGRTWRVSRERLAHSPGPVQRITALGATLDYTMTLEPHGKDWLYVLDAPVEGPRLADPSPRWWATVGDGLTFAANQPVRRRIQLRARSALNYRLAPAETVDSLRDWTRLPSGFNPRTTQLAQNLLAAGESPQALIQRVLTMIREQPFRYTLNPPPLGLHSVDEFLFDTRAGFCEHYASAFTVLMRAMNIPARVVIGFQGGDINGADGYLEVRERDAHAWTEVWLGESRGWVRVDPTAAVAPARIERGIAWAFGRQSGVFNLSPDNAIVQALRTWKDRWSAIENGWNQWVLRYNNGAQRALFKQLGMREPDWSQLLLTTIAVLGTLSAAMAAWVLGRRPRPDPLAKAFARFEAKLVRRGIIRPEHEPPLAFARRLDHELDAASAAQARAIIDAYISLRYRAPHSSNASIPITYRQFTQWISEFHAGLLS